MSAFSANSIALFLRKVVQDQWREQYNSEEDGGAIVDMIDNPIDYTEFISTKLLHSNVAVIYKEKGYMISEQQRERIFNCAKDDYILTNQLHDFMPSLKTYDVYIDTRDFAKMVGYNDIKEATRTITGFVPNVHQKRLSDFGIIPIIHSNKINITSKKGIIDPNKRIAREINTNRRYFHIEALSEVIQRVYQAQRKGNKHGINRYDIYDFKVYFERVEKYALSLNKIISVEIISYLSSYNAKIIAEAGSIIRRHTDNYEQLESEMNKLFFPTKN